MNIEKRKKIAIKASKEAGRILKNGFRKTVKIENKGDRDLVTDIDRKANEAIIKLIKENFPEDNILSEENFSISGVDNSSLDRENLTEYRWIIDPLDGTHNFVHNIDIFGVSVAVEFEDEVSLGVIYMPFTEELYVAQKGKGAYCNGKKIETSKRDLNKATLVYDSSIRYNKRQMLETLDNLVDKAFNIRMFGSTVRSLTYLAEGKVDAEIEFNDKVWDFASGLLLIEEAGGKVTDFKGERWETDTEQYIASNGNIHEDILETIKNNIKR